VVRILLSCLLLCFSTLGYALTQVTATIDKNPVALGESIVLEITADDDIDSDDFDPKTLQQLLSQDFMVGNTSVSSQTSIINFNRSYTTTWRTILIPKRTGALTIPAITINDKQTAPIALVVTEPDKAHLANRDIFIKNSVSSNNVYVQQQFILTTRLYFATELKQGALSEPQMTGATFKSLGKDKESTEIINGKRYRVIERSYAVKPQQSGEFTLTTPQFNGEILSGNRRNDMFFNFAETKPVAIAPEQININVKPIPAENKGAWLPSDLLMLSEEWQPNKNTFKVGDPITRIITLTARGLSEEQLPDISVTTPEGLTIYPDQPQLHTKIRQNQLLAQKVQNFALVATKPGRYTLPAVTLYWWNTQTNRLQQASLPARTIDVLPSDNTVTSTPLNTTASDKPATSSPEVPQPCATETTLVQPQSSWLQWLFLTLWLLTGFAWGLVEWNRKRKQPPAVHHDAPSAIYQQIIKACEQNNGQLVLSLLVPWFNQLPNIKSCHSIADGLAQINDEQLTNLINELQSCYYGKQTKTWQGNALKVCIQQLAQQSARKKPATAWTKLNP
jgi:hypothetical protein